MEGIKLGVPTGWQCPICGRVYAPIVMECLYCGNDQTVTTTDNTSETITNTYITAVTAGGDLHE